MKIRQGDRLKIHRAKAYDEDEYADLTLFVGGIVFKMVSRSTGLIVTGTAAGDAVGNLSYEWLAGDTDEVGIYDAVYIGTDATGRTQTFPTDVNLVVEVIAQI